MSERLTEKRVYAPNGYKYLGGTDNFGDGVKKLGQLEDIEEELGIDLLTLFKALTKGAWIREGLLGWCYTDGEPVFVKPERLHFSTKTYYLESRANDSSANGEENVACIFDMEWEDIYHIAKIKDYGKTWALTKEELL